MRSWKQLAEILLSPSVEISKKLDLCGEVCPQTYVKTWLALEELEVGQVLQVKFDFAQAVQDVPKSLSSEGHEVLGVQPAEGGTWLVTVRKKG